MQPNGLVELSTLYNSFLNKEYRSTQPSVAVIFHYAVVRAQTMLGRFLRAKSKLWTGKGAFAHCKTSF